MILILAPRPSPFVPSIFRVARRPTDPQYSKAVQRSADKKPANEFKDLWVQRVYIVASHAFPTNRRRCGMRQWVPVLVVWLLPDI